MDNFMDKLAKRFNAGEMIKANAQAEARDMKRLQERAAEYEKMMQEMRRLNLKNVEVTEQVQQLIQCGIEQFEGYGNGEALIGKKLEELEVELAEIKESSKGNGNELDQMIASLQGDLSGVSSSVGNMRNDILGIGSNVSVLKNDISNVGTGINTVQYQLGTVENSIQALTQLVQEGMNKGIDAEALAPITNSIEAVREILVATRTSVEEGNKKLEEHVHKENVRVYRNVQASIVDETTRKSREIHSRLDQIEGEVKKSGGVKTIAIITMLAAIASVAIQIVQMLGVM